MTPTLKVGGGNGAKRVKIGLGLLLLVLAAQTAGSIALARRSADPCKAGPIAERIAGAAEGVCHVS